MGYAFFFPLLPVLIFLSIVNSGSYLLVKECNIKWEYAFASITPSSNLPYYSKFR